MSLKTLVPLNTVALAANPTGTVGDIYMNTTSKALFYHDGTSWQPCGVVGGADTVPALTWSQVKNGVTLTTRVIPPLTWADVKNGITL
jgi:hypothetical protein